jgi:hypothetical protein
MMNWECSGRKQEWRNRRTLSAFAEGTEENTKNLSVPEEIWTKHIRNKSLEGHRNASLLDKSQESKHILVRVKYQR